jgi:hypothetical protein
VVDVYKVSVSLVLANGVSPVLGTIARDVLGLKVPIKAIEDAFGGWKTILTGVGAVLGVTILGAMVDLVDKAKEFNKELVALQRVGGSMTTAVTSGAIKAKAFDIAQRVPLKVEDIAKIMGNSYSVLRGNMSEVYAAAEPMATLGYVLNHDKKYKGDVNKDVMNALRAGELTGRMTDANGQIDVQKMKDWFDFVARVSTATHGTVNGTTLLGMAQQGGFTMRNLSPEGMATMAIASQVMGGQRAGTAFMSLWQQMGAGTMFTRTAKGLSDLGFLETGKDWYTDHGRVILNDSGKQKLSSLISQDPMVFAQEIKKRLDEKGITDPAARTSALMSMLNRQTTQRLMGEMFTNMQQQLSERGIMMQGYGAGQSLDLMKSQELQANIDSFQTAWHNLLVALGDPMVATAVTALQSITGPISTLATFASSHGDAIKQIAGVLAAFAGGLVLIGGISLIALAGLPALLGAGVAAIAAIIALNWKQVTEDFTNYGHAVAYLITLPWKGLVEMFNGIQSALSGFISYISGLYDKVKGIFSGAVREGNKLMGSPPLGAAPMAFHPGAHPMKAQPISLSLNVDGRTLAQAISDQLTRLYGYPTNAPVTNDASRWSSSDDYSDDI